GVLLRAKKAGGAVVWARVGDPPRPTGEQLVWIGLVADIPHQLVGRAIEHPMERYSKLDRPEVRRQVTTGLGHSGQQLGADLRGELLQLVGREPLYVGRTLDRVEQAGHVTSGEGAPVSVYQLTLQDHQAAPAAPTGREILRAPPGASPSCPVLATPPELGGQGGP